MKATVLACLVAAAILAPTLPARADEQHDAFAACLKELSSNEGISRNQLKGFRIDKSGPGYEVTGVDENGQRVSCKTHGTRVTDVRVG